MTADWILCRDELPAPNVEVLVIDARDPTDPGLPWIAWRGAGVEWVWNERDDDWSTQDRFTHWQPLPPPPKEAL